VLVVVVLVVVVVVVVGIVVVVVVGVVVEISVAVPNILLTPTQGPSTDSAGSAQPNISRLQPPRVAGPRPRPSSNGICKSIDAKK
jgi:hypothetical protein